MTDETLEQVIWAKFLKAQTTSVSIVDWRCAKCHDMQRAGTTQIWVPKINVMSFDPPWYVQKQIEYAQNHEHTSCAWCKDCAERFGLIEQPPKPQPQTLSLWERIKRGLRRSDG